MDTLDYYAFLDKNNIVVEVIGGPKQAGSAQNWEYYYSTLRNMPCKRGSFTGDYRKNYPSVGFIYDEARDAFIAPRPEPANFYTLNETTCRWEMTPAGQQYYITEAVKQHLDTVAGERQYDGIVSLIGYLNSPVAQWAAEAAAGNVWRSAVWVKVYEIQQQVQSGQRPIPTPTEVIAELPLIQWPAG